MRCRLVCRDWHRAVRRHVEGGARARARRERHWRRAECSFYPITPSMYSPAPPAVTASSSSDGGGADCSYRNVLSLKCDECEIMLAVDNGNVEVYDRWSLRLKTVLVGQVSLIIEKFLSRSFRIAVFFTKSLFS